MYILFKFCNKTCLNDYFIYIIIIIIIIMIFGALLLRCKRLKKGWNLVHFSLTLSYSADIVMHLTQ